MQAPCTPTNSAPTTQVSNTIVSEFAKLGMGFATDTLKEFSVSMSQNSKPTETRPPPPPPPQVFVIFYYFILLF